MKRSKTEKEGEEAIKRKRENQFKENRHKGKSQWIRFWLLLPQPPPPLCKPLDKMRSFVFTSKQHTFRHSRANSKRLKIIRTTRTFIFISKQEFDHFCAYRRRFLSLSLSLSYPAPRLMLVYLVSFFFWSPLTYIQLRHQNQTGLHKKRVHKTAIKINGLNGKSYVDDQSTKCK